MQMQVFLHLFCFDFLNVRFDSLLSLANKALTYDDQLSDGYWARGFYYFHFGGDHEKALAEFNTALKYNPNHWWALINKADIYQYRDFARSFEYMHQAIWVNPEDKNTDWILQRLIMMYKSAGFFDKAEYYNQELLKLNRDSA